MPQKSCEPQHIGRKRRGLIQPKNTSNRVQVRPRGPSQPEKNVNTGSNESFLRIKFFRIPINYLSPDRDAPICQTAGSRQDEWSRRLCDGECLRNVIRRQADKSSELAVEPVQRSPALPSTHEARPGPGRGHERTISPARKP